MAGGCLACGGALFEGPEGRRHHADRFVCRECQRSPATQMRVHLARARANGMTFDRAWEFAWMAVRWPHDTDQRHEWKQAIGNKKVQRVFRAAYANEAPSRSDQQLAQLAA